MANDIYWLVCGGREFQDHNMMHNAMRAIVHRIGFSPTHIVHGDARGADRMAGQWALDNSIEEIKRPADWDKHGKAAGSIRNKEMLYEFRPTVVIAFPGGTGTANMIGLAKDADWEPTVIEINAR